MLCEQSFYRRVRLLFPASELLASKISLAWSPRKSQRPSSDFQARSNLGKILWNIMSCFRTPNERFLFSSPTTFLSLSQSRGSFRFSKNLTNSSSTPLEQLARAVSRSCLGSSSSDIQRLSKQRKGQHIIPLLIFQFLLRQISPSTLSLPRRTFSSSCYSLISWQACLCTLTRPVLGLGELANRSASRRISRYQNQVQMRCRRYQLMACSALRRRMPECLSSRNSSSSQSSSLLSTRREEVTSAKERLSSILSALPTLLYASTYSSSIISKIVLVFDTACLLRNAQLIPRIELKVYLLLANISQHFSRVLKGRIRPIMKTSFSISLSRECSTSLLSFLSSEARLQICSSPKGFRDQRKELSEPSDSIRLRRALKSCLRYELRWYAVCLRFCSSIQIDIIKTPMKIRCKFRSPRKAQSLQQHFGAQLIPFSHL